MRSELEKIREIEDYLLGKLNDANQQIFEEKISLDIKLSREVEWQKILMHRVISHSTRTEVVEAGKRYNSGNNFLYGDKGLGILLVTLITIGSLVFFYNKESIFLSNEEPAEFNRTTVADSTEINLKENSITLDSSKVSNLGHDKEETAVENLSKNTVQKEPKIKINPVSIEMVEIEGGSFDIGDNYSIDMKSYELSKYEITQAQWHEVMRENPSHFQGCDQCPIENVSWDDIQIFIKKLNQRNNSDYRLPTHPEWSFAVRGGTKRSGFMYYKDKMAMRKMAWCVENSVRKTHEVGLKKPNELGIYDLNGNVWEWVADVWPDDYDSNIKSRHNRSEDKSDKILLGGSYSVSSRDFYMVWYLPEFSTPNVSSPNLGFRLARSLENNLNRIYQFN